MTEQNQADIEEVLPADTEQEVVETTVETTPEQDPLKNELEKIREKKGRSKVEKLLYTKKRVDDQLKEEGIVLEDDKPEDEDDKPLTKGEFKRLQAQTATKTALDLADDISNETERELTKHYLENTIKSTGNPQEDFQLARTLVNAVKNKQIIEEVARKPEPKTHGSGAGAPANMQKPKDDLTEAELAFTRAPWNLSKEQIIKARPQE